MNIPKLPEMPAVVITARPPDAGWEVQEQLMKWYNEELTAWHAKVFKDAIPVYGVSGYPATSWGPEPFNNDDVQALVINIRPIDKNAEAKELLKELMTGIDHGFDSNDSSQSVIAKVRAFLGKSK